MKTRDDATAALVGQQQALDVYFDALFHSNPVPGAGAADRTQDPERQAPAVPEQAAPDQVESVQENITKAAEPALQVQVFKVAGLSLAVPRERVSSVLSNQSGLTDVPESTGLVLGTLRAGNVQARLVDTARLVLPPERAGRLAADSAAHAGCALILDDGRWALACSEVTELAALSEKDITWRTAAGKRPWLAGMVTRRRWALLDVDQLLQLLQDSVA